MPRPDRNIRVDAVVLRHSDWGETDRLLVLYSKEQGKLRAIAKGLRKIQSRKAGHLEPFTRVTLMLAKGHDLWIVTQAEAIDLYQPIRENLQKMVHAAYVVELLDRFTYEEGQNWQLYKLLTETLERLSALEDDFVPLRFYETRLLSLLGYQPLLFECAACGDEIIAQSQYFSADMGGVLCPQCGARGQSSRPVSLEALRFLRHFQRSDFKQALRANPPQTIRQEIDALQYYYLTYLLERSLNTPEFLKQIQRPL
ncbi:MAG: DNA repair protein RecO [Anaerolineaceae bacterium]|nr:DNA repair protein RecO [Anaerolineaceae bacterium]